MSQIHIIFSADHLADQPDRLVTKLTDQQAHHPLEHAFLK